jgi:hypothetical protein
MIVFGSAVGWWWKFSFSSTTLHFDASVIGLNHDANLAD